MKSFSQYLKEAMIDKNEFIEKMTPIAHLTKNPYNRLNAERWRIEILTILQSLGVPKKTAEKVFDSATNRFAAQNRSGVMLYTPIGVIYDELKIIKLVESSHFKVGDDIHLGVGEHGGVDGKITKIEDGFVWIKNKWHGKEQKGQLKFARKQ